MLWLALRFPRLPLDALALPPVQPPIPPSSSASAPPRAAVAGGKVAAVDGAAAALGVAPGMGLASAWGLAPTLAVVERSPVAEARALEGLACWAGNFTPQVCLDPPAGLLLEIGGCLRLFGGLDVLLEQACRGLAEQGYALAAACAPTPLAARWLANGAPVMEPGGPPEHSDPGRGTGTPATGSFSGCSFNSPVGNEAPPSSQGGQLQARSIPVCTELAELSEFLGPLSLDCLELAASIRSRLENFGTRRLDDLLALPRAGLSRRLGPELALDLSRALGEVPDPRPRFPFPETFRQGLELPARVEDASTLLFAARRLLEGLQGWLAARSAGVARCTLALDHEGRAPTALVLGFAGQTRDGTRLERVLRERLGNLSLAAPVQALTLTADEVGDLPGEDRLLPGQAEEGGADPERVAVVVERLRARLGPDKVYGLAAVADHRPERATRKCTLECTLDKLLGPAMAESKAGSVSAVMPGQGPRPLWLLACPRPLNEHQGRPWHAGPLSLLAGPERIESGWWDDGERSGEGITGDQRRDYFVARNPQGEWLWIFRDEAGWFLHGSFA
ncbi:MAG TPA: DNA polymerase Y family protein [Azospira sp.]|nr:DNA polymerase Y family protein [Azospira sp.]